MNYWNWAIIVSLFLLGTSVTGCIRDIIKVDTPPAAVEEGYPASIPLSEVGISIEAYTMEKQQIILTWQKSAEVAEEKAAYWSSMLGAVISPEGLTALGLNPAGGAAASLLYFFGLMTRKPGDASPQIVAKEKESSYNAGLDKGKEIKNG
jgi:hypothetical protein